MGNRAETTRRGFVVCCACAGCVGLSRAAASPDGGGNAQGAAATAAKKVIDFAYCGIYCAACELHLKADQNGNTCPMCTHPAKTSSCVILACAREKKVANCGVCESFENCEKLKKHHENPLYRRVARRTCSEIRRDGLEKVSAQQKSRWTCPSCGKVVPWNNAGACPYCGKPVVALSEKDA